MVYFIVQDWQNTHGNHAGMVHLCKRLKEINSSEIELFIVPNIRFLGRNNMLLQTITYFLYSCYLLFKIERANSKVFLMEYLLTTHNQYIIAKTLSTFRNIPIYGLAHLVPSDLDRYFPSDNAIEKWINPLDKIFTLGSSLSNYLLKRGIDEKKIVTSFHYVDLDYYNIANKNNIPKEVLPTSLTVIIMGSMKRDFETLINVMNKIPNVHFVFCIGNKTVDKTLLLYPKNVDIYGYIPEDKLRFLMSKADISLNIMYDTVGSNVITTSLAMGLAMIVSDVGSIRDYCNQSNAIFCKKTQEIIDAINLLILNREKLEEMKKASLEISKKLSISKFYDVIQML